MAKRRSQSAAALTGAEEFAGADAEMEAIEKIAAAKASAAKEAEADKKKGDNGGPILDADAWRRACLEYSAEMLEMESLAEKQSEIAGRISSIRKVARKCKVDWDLVKRYYADHKVIRKGGMGAMVTDERRYRQLLKLMGSPLGTQFSLWDVEPDEPAGASAKPGMDAELQGQHAYSNSEDRENNPFTPGTDDYADWDRGWNNAFDATARNMGPTSGAAAN